MTPESKARHESALRLRREGLTYAAIAQRIRCSPARAAQIVAKAEWLEEPRPNDGLSVRAANALRYVLGGEPIPEAVAQLSARELQRDYNNCGKKSIAEIRAWLAQHGMAFKGEAVNRPIYNAGTPGYLLPTG